MKALFSVTLLLGLCVIPIIIETPQPEPFYVDEFTCIQPILENADLQEVYQYTRSIKFCYRDPMTKPLQLRDGSYMNSYCSDRSQVTFITAKNDTITAISQQRMSCDITCIVNFQTYQIHNLMLSRLKVFKIKNLVTDNEYTFNLDTDYFQKNLKP